MILGKIFDNYNIEQIKIILNENLKDNKDLEQFKELIFHCLEEKQEKRFNFQQIISYLNNLLNIQFDPELVIQHEISLENEIKKNKEIIKQKDKLERTLIHQVLLF